MIKANGKLDASGGGTTKKAMAGSGLRLMAKTFPSVINI